MKERFFGRLYRMSELCVIAIKKTIFLKRKSDPGDIYFYLKNKACQQIHGNGIAGIYIFIHSVREICCTKFDRYSSGGKEE